MITAALDVLVTAWTDGPSDGLPIPRPEHAGFQIARHIELPAPYRLADRCATTAAKLLPYEVEARYHLAYLIEDEARQQGHAHPRVQEVSNMLRSWTPLARRLHAAVSVHGLPAVLEALKVPPQRLASWMHEGQVPQPSWTLAFSRLFGISRDEVRSLIVASQEMPPRYAPYDLDARSKLFKQQERRDYRRGELSQLPEVRRFVSIARSLGWDTDVDVYVELGYQYVDWVINEESDPRPSWAGPFLRHEGMGTDQGAAGVIICSHRLHPVSLAFDVGVYQDRTEITAGEIWSCGMPLDEPWSSQAELTQTFWHRLSLWADEVPLDVRRALADKVLATYDVAPHERNPFELCRTETLGYLSIARVMAMPTTRAPIAL